MAEEWSRRSSGSHFDSITTTAITIMTTITVVDMCISISSNVLIMMRLFVVRGGGGGCV